MSLVLYALPAQFQSEDSGLALTFVIPAQQCNLKCAFCVIKQRNEVTETVLAPEDYAYFLRDVANTETVSVASIQGYEPLLDESWPYFEAIMGEARTLGIQSGFVTNGIQLEQRCRDIASLGTSGFTVSIDSANALIHDKLRGVPGALEKTLRGVRAMTAIDGWKDKITVTSVLIPGRKEFLVDMPALVAKLGLRSWAINPLLRIGKEAIGGPVGLGASIVEDVQILAAHAAKLGVQVYLDDEIGQLGTPDIEYPKYIRRKFDRPGGLYRLTPDGVCSRGTQVLQRISSDMPRWNPKTTTPRKYIERLDGLWPERGRSKMDSIASLGNVIPIRTFAAEPV